MIKVQVINKEGTIIAEAAGTKEVNLPVSRTYEEGDRVVFLADETPAFYVFQADDALGEALVYVTGEVSYEIPFGEKKVCYSPKSFGHCQKGKRVGIRIIPQFGRKCDGSARRY